jgi:hypothetical protein
MPTPRYNFEQTGPRSMSWNTSPVFRLLTAAATVVPEPFHEDDFRPLTAEPSLATCVVSSKKSTHLQTLSNHHSVARRDPSAGYGGFIPGYVSGGFISGTWGRMMEQNNKRKDDPSENAKFGGLGTDELRLTTQ